MSNSPADRQVNSVAGQIRTVGSTDFTAKLSPENFEKMLGDTKGTPPAAP